MLVVGGNNSLCTTTMDPDIMNELIGDISGNLLSSLDKESCILNALELGVENIEKLVKLLTINGNKTRIALEVIEIAERGLECESFEYLDAQKKQKIIDILANLRKGLSN